MQINADLKYKWLHSVCSLSFTAKLGQRNWYFWADHVSKTSKTTTTEIMRVLQFVLSKTISRYMLPQVTKKWTKSTPYLLKFDSNSTISSKPTETILQDLLCIQWRIIPWVNATNFGTRKAEVLNSLIINTTDKANDTTDILQTFR